MLLVWSLAGLVVVVALRIMSLLFLRSVLVLLLMLMLLLLLLRLVRGMVPAVLRKTT